MGTYRYSEWDGTQDLFELDADELMDELERNLMSYGDLSSALRMLQRGDIRDAQGRRLPSIQDLLQQLRQRRQNQLDRYNLGSVVNEIKEKVEKILKTEQQGIQKRLNEARQKAKEEAGELSPEVRERLLKTMEEMAAQHLNKLDELPPDIGGQIRELSQYDFMDDEARRQFDELMDMLKKHAMQSYAQDLVQKLKDMDASAMTDIRHLVEAINQMLEQRLRGEEPDFGSFMEQFGHFFGPNPPRNLDELIERLQNQIAQAQSLMESMSPEDRQELEDLLRSMLDNTTSLELAKMAANLEMLFPSDRLHRQYPFTGEESISYNEALKLMEMLQKMDKLEGQLRESQYNLSLDDIDEKLVRELLGDEAKEQLEKLNDITRVLEEAGYIRWKDGKLELTPRGIRKIGQKALADIFAQLRKDHGTGHKLKVSGQGGERLEETKPYEFGDEFELDLQKTVMNSLYREPETPPLKLKVDDFEVIQREATARTSIVLMLDLSLSMFLRGYFEAGKRTAIALDSLISSQYPKDNLYIIVFSQRARIIKKEDLLFINRNSAEQGTNLQEALYLARKLMAKERSTNKQIIIVSDGEPTAHIEGDDVFFQHPPTLRTLQLTLKEVRDCTQKGIVINTFMFDDSHFLSNFVVQMACLNKGRVFFADADNLGKYVLVDYIARKKKMVW